MHLLQSVACLFGRHARGPRSKVWNDGRYYRSICPGCGKPMLRDMNGWRPLTKEERENLVS